MIEWMENTIPLKELLYGTFTEDEQKFIASKSVCKNSMTCE